MPPTIAHRASGLLRFWLTLDEPVDRRRYLLHGASLMLFKYAVDATVVWLTAGVFWTPLDYLSPFYLDRIRVTGSVVWLDWAFVAWTLPFLWVGVSMTVRRAADAGLTPWLVLLFFVPFLNYALMLTLAAVPSRAPEGWRGEPTPPVADARLRSALLGAALGVLISVGMVFRSAVWLEEYAATLFLATPFVLGATCAFIHNHGHPRSGAETMRVVAVSLLLGGGAILLFALEGALCIVMALPLALPVALLGGVLGRAIALRAAARPGPGAVAAVLVPLLISVPGAPPPGAPFEVVTAVEVDAPPEAVWEHVVGFEELPPPGRLVFRLGIAHPRRARIDGTGVGAVRRCEFSTGPFVEPITVWEPGRRLSFDVTSQPPPLEEWSPYASVHPPHLDGYFRSVRGEFRLIPLAGGRTRLEGSTWYELDLAPTFYWRIHADWLVHRIHERVLAHVKARAEERS